MASAVAAFAVATALAPPADAIESATGPIEHTQAEGTDQTTIRIGSLLPMGEPPDSQAAAVDALLVAYFQHVNAAKRIHGRRIEYAAIDAGLSVQTALEGLHRIRQGARSSFGLVANAGTGADRRTLAALSEQGIPVVGPLTFDEVAPAGGSVFQLLATLNDQARAAARFLVDEQAGQRAPASVVVTPERPALAMAEAFLSEAERLGLTVGRFTISAADAAGVAARLAEHATRDIVLLGGNEIAAAFLVAAQRLNWQPRVVASGVLIGERLQGAGLETALFWPPIGPTPDQSHAEAFERLLESLPAAARNPSQRPMQMAAYAAAELLVDALERAGRELTREGMLEALAQTRDFATGLMPAVSFGSARRLGVRGALITTQNAEGKPVTSRWIEVAVSSP